MNKEDDLILKINSTNMLLDKTPKDTKLFIVLNNLLLEYSELKNYLKQNCTHLWNDRCNISDLDEYTCEKCGCVYNDINDDVFSF